MRALCFVALLCTAAACNAAAPARQAAAPRAAQAILEDMAAARLALSPQKSPDADADRSARRWWAELALELYRAEPNHPHAALMLRERWRSMCAALDAYPAAVVEIESLVADPATPAAVLEEGRHSLALAHLGQLAAATGFDRAGVARAQQALDEFLAGNPRDPRGFGLAWSLALASRGDPLLERQAYARLLRDWPESRRAVVCRGKLRQLDAVGSPFDLPDFADGLGRGPVDVSAWRGSVVVVVFFDSSVERSRASLDRYRSVSERPDWRDVVFVGVSLDDMRPPGALERWRLEAAELGLRWPIHCLGEGWTSPFAQAWGIVELPTVFVVGRDGRLVSTSAEVALEKLLESASAVSVQIGDAAGQRR